MSDLCWVEINKENLSKNIRELRARIKAQTILCPCVKANAYGHGLTETGKIFLSARADWLSVNSIYEAISLRESGITAPIYILGYVSLNEIPVLCHMREVRIVVYNYETIDKISETIIKDKSATAPQLHIKVETGNNRQGVLISDLLKFANHIKSKNLEIEGIATHFANIEDTTDHSYAQLQFDRFKSAINLLEKNGFQILYKHCANSAATILFEDVKLNFVRPGIASYGMWPSNETKLSAFRTDKNINLSSALTWKSKIAQIKIINIGESIGYGCAYKTSHESKIAIIPVGYYDGYDRGINNAYVLINGKRAPLRGRVCMNIVMVEVTDIPEAKLEDEVVLIGMQGDEEISAEVFASWASTINYEVTTRINDRIPRFYV